MSLVAKVMAEPPERRLDMALYLLAEVTGRPDESYAHLRTTYGLTKGQSTILCALAAAYPRMMTKDALFATLGRDEISPNIVTVYIFHIRRKTNAKIRTVWGDGFVLDEPFEIVWSAPPDRARQRLPWTAQDDADLRAMLASGSRRDVIAEELERSEASIRDRIQLLRKMDNRKKPHDL